MNPSSSVAARLQPHHRQELAINILSKQEPISHLAHQEGVSRKFHDQQKAIAQQALTTAFDKPEKDNEVLYYLPVTQKWIFQLILALILICHCSYRGVIESNKQFKKPEKSIKLKIYRQLRWLCWMNSFKVIDLF